MTKDWRLQIEREHPIFAKNLFLEFDGETGRRGKFIRLTIINQGQFATLGCSLLSSKQDKEHEEEKSEEPVPITITKGYSHDHRPD